MEPYVISLIGAFLAALGSFFVAITEKYRRSLALAIFVGALASIWGSHLQGKESEYLITGGDSYCYVTVQAGGGGEGWMSNPIVWCKGEYPAYDVSGWLYDPEMLKEKVSQEDLLNKGFQFDVGTIFPNGQKMLGGTRKVNFVEDDRKVLRAYIMTRNSYFVEDLLFKRIEHDWLRAIRLYKAKPNGLRDKLIDEWAEPDFPRDSDGKILWTD